MTNWGQAPLRAQRDRSAVRLTHRGTDLSYTRGQARGVGVCFCRCVLTQKGLAAMRGPFCGCQRRLHYTRTSSWHLPRPTRSFLRT